MCNCNRQRANYTANNIPSKKGMVKVMLIKNTPMTLNGNVTGRMYVFRNMNDIHWVDKRDAMSMQQVNELQVFY